MLLSLGAAALATGLFFRGLFVPPKTNTSVNTEPLAPPRFRRLVYVVLDALRYDGLVPVDKTGEYFNRMPIMSDPAVHSRSFLSIAGLPTATKCRVIALLTGAPTLQFDEVSAFINGNVTTDSILNSCAQKKLMFFGDDCWTSNFPAVRGRGDVMCSFLKYDLTTKEDELFEKLIENMPATDAAGNSTGCDYLFAHFISLDMCGHQYGYAHPSMTAALERFNRYLYRLYARLPDDTLLVAVSDHGATDYGAHGGCSPPELASSCAFFSKKPLATTPPPPLYNRFLSRFYDVSACGTPRDWLATRAPYTAIHQDDVLPTVACLLGLPVPTCAYGNLIPQLISCPAAHAALARHKARQDPGALSAEAHALSPAEHARFTAWLAADGHAAPPADTRAWDTAAWRAYNYFITERIYLRYTRISWLPLAASLVIGAVLLVWSAVRARPLLPLAHTVLAIATVSHSLNAFACEDYVWQAMLFLECPSPATLVALLFYLKTPGRLSLADERAKVPVARFGSVWEACLLLGLYVLVRALRVTPRAKASDSACGGVRSWVAQAAAAVQRVGVDSHFVGTVRARLPQVAYCLYRHCSGDASTDSVLAFLGSFPSLASLVATHLRPLNALLVLICVSTLRVPSTATARYALLSLIPYLCDMEKTIQSIDCNVFFAISPRYELPNLAISFLSYFVLLRVEALRACRTREGAAQLFFLNVAGLYASMLTSVVLSGTLTFQLFFFSRLLFVTGFCFFDVCAASVIDYLRGWRSTSHKLATSKINK